MLLRTKILLIVGGVILLGALFFIIYKQNEISKRQEAIETNMVAQKELADNITRSQSQFATKDDISDFIKNNNVNLQSIQDDLKKLHADISSVNVVTVQSTGQSVKGVPSTSTGDKNPNPIPPNTPDPFGYLSNQQTLSLFEDFNTKVPIGSVSFSAWQQNPWSYTILPRQYKVTTVLGKDENERDYYYNKVSIVVDNKTYDLKIDQADSKQEYPDPHFSWWNPRLFLGIDSGLNISTMNGEFSPSINLGIASYGRYKNTPDWSFLGLGIGYDMVSKKPEGLITPFTFNLGTVLPLIKNTYVGPSLHLNTSAEFSITGGLRIGL